MIENDPTEIQPPLVHFAKIRVTKFPDHLQGDPQSDEFRMGGWRDVIDVVMWEDPTYGLEPFFLVRDDRDKEFLLPIHKGGWEYEWQKTNEFTCPNLHL
jgi:hypothetical protein